MTRIAIVEIGSSDSNFSKGFIFSLIKIMYLWVKFSYKKNLELLIGIIFKFKKLENNIKLIVCFFLLLIFNSFVYYKIKVN